MLSSMDDYPIHQIAAPVRHVGSSDRNFYDRYYFNLHGSSDELFMVMGMGQYPNLATQDCFACVRRGDSQHVVRASRKPHHLRPSAQHAGDAQGDITATDQQDSLHARDSFIAPP